MNNGRKTILALGIALMHFVPIPSRAQNVFAASNWNTLPLPSAPHGSELLAILVPSGNYVVNGKVSVHNLDSDPQPAVCRIHVWIGFPDPRGAQFALDRTEVRLDHRDGGDQQSVALEGIVTIGSPFAPIGGRISMACTTPNGTATDVVITAIQTTGTVNVPPCTNPLGCNPYTFPP